MFINETAAATNMERRYRRPPRRQRCRITVPHGHQKATTVTAASRASNPYTIALLDGATNSIKFRAHVTDVSGPALDSGDTVVVVDEFAAPKVASVRQLVEATGVQLLYLPLYNLNFSPIDDALAKLKAMLRSAAIRTVPNLCATISKASIPFEPGECRNYVAAAIYDMYAPI